MIYLTVTIRVRDSELSRWFALIGAHASQSRLEPGCIRFDVLRGVGENRLYELRETWLDHAALAAHRLTAHYAHWREEIATIEAEPRQHREYVRLLAPGADGLVFTNGCFDCLHAGHVHLLREARAQGGLLVVAVNDDESVRRLKGDGRPVQPLAERLRNLHELRCVDEVLPFSTETELREIIEGTAPAVLVKGDDYSRAEVIGARHAGRVHLVERIHGLSTSRIVAVGGAHLHPCRRAG